MTNNGEISLLLLLVVGFGQAINALPAPVEIAPAAKNLAPGYGK